MLPSDFGKYLKEKRELIGFSMGQLAKLARVSQAYISQLENGQRNIPSPEIINKLAGPLRVAYIDMMKEAGHISSSEYNIETYKYVLRSITNSTIHALSVDGELPEDSPEINKIVDKYRSYLGVEFKLTSASLREFEKKHEDFFPEWATDFLDELHDMSLFKEKIEEEEDERAERAMNRVHPPVSLGDLEEMKNEFISLCNSVPEILIRLADESGIGFTRDLEGHPEEFFQYLSIDQKLYFRDRLRKNIVGKIDPAYKAAPVSFNDYKAKNPSSLIIEKESSNNLLDKIKHLADKHDMDLNDPLTLDLMDSALDFIKKMKSK